MALPKIVVAGNDASTLLARNVTAHLKGKDYKVVTFIYGEYGNFATLAEAAAQCVTDDAEKNTIGILISETGMDVCAAANKIPGALAAQIHDPYTSRRAHEFGANIITFGAFVENDAQMLPELRACSWVDYFLSTRPGPGDASNSYVEAINAVDRAHRHQTKQ